MAIFTGLDNTLKETLNVDYNERTTDQKVKFLNKENEYWGHFNGSFNPTSISVENGSLSNVTLYNARLLTEGGREIDITKYGQDLADLQTDIEGLQEDIETKCGTMEGKIGNISANTEFQVKNACAALSIDIKRDLTDQVEDLGDDLTHYIDRKATDISVVMDAKLESVRTQAKSALELSVQQLVHTDRISAHILDDKIEQFKSFTSLSVEHIADRVDNAFSTIMAPVELSVQLIKADLNNRLNGVDLSVAGVKQKVTEDIEEISQNVDLSVATIKHDLDLSVETMDTKINNLAEATALSVQNLVDEDTLIKAAVSLANKRITENERDTSTSAFNINQKADENARRIEEVNRVLSGRIDEDYVKLSENYVNDADFLRHYKLNNVNTAAEFLAVEDYAINIIEDDVVEGYLVKDGVKFGKVETIDCDADGKITAFRIVVFEGDGIPQELGVGAFIIKPGEATPTGFGEYYYTWNIEGDGKELRGKLRVKSESSYKYCMASDSNLSLFINYPEFNGGIISAGYVVVESDKSDYMDLVNLTKGGHVRFDNHTSILSSDGCGLSYHGGNEYGLSVNVVHYPYFAIENGIETTARIPSETVFRDESTSELLSCAIKKEGRTLNLSKNEETGIYEALVADSTFIEYDPSTFAVTSKNRLSCYKAVGLSPADGHLMIASVTTNKMAEEAVDFNEFKTLTLTFGEMVKPALAEFNGQTVQLTKTGDAWNTATLIGATSSLTVSIEGFQIVFKHTVSSGTEITRKYDFSFDDFDFVDASEIETIGTVDWAVERDDPSMDEVILTVDTSRIYSKGELFDQQFTIEPSHSSSLKVAVSPKKIDGVDIFDSGRVREFSILFKLAGAVEKDVTVDFFDENGAPITVITDKHTTFTVRSGKVPASYTYFKFIEVAKNKFLAVNMNFDKTIRDIIDTKNNVAKLSANLAAEILRATTAETELSSDLTELVNTEATIRSAQIHELSARVKGGINYRGFIEYKLNSEGQEPKSLSALFTNNGYDAPFYAGYQYRVSLDESVHPYYELPHDGITLENGDDIYFKNDVSSLAEIEVSDIDIDHNVNQNIVTQTQLNLSVDTINGRLETFDTEASELSAELASEIERAKAAETTETTRALSAEEGLQAQIDANKLAIEGEQSRAETEEAALSAAISTEKTRASTVESELSAEFTAGLEAEKTRAESVEEAIVGRLDEVFNKTTCEGGEVTIDSLVLTDITRVPEGEAHDKYKLVIKEGTLVLVKI